MKWIVLALLTGLVAGCDRQPVSEDVRETVSERRDLTNSDIQNPQDPTRGAVPNARKDALGETGTGAGVIQKPSEGGTNAASSPQ